MPAYIYNKMVEEATKSGVTLTKFTEKASSWLIQKYAQINKEDVRPVRFINEAERKNQFSARNYTIVY